MSVKAVPRIAAAEKIWGIHAVEHQDRQDPINSPHQPVRMFILSLLPAAECQKNCRFQPKEKKYQQQGLGMPAIFIGHSAVLFCLHGKHHRKKHTGACQQKDQQKLFYYDRLQPVK